MTKHSIHLCTIYLVSYKSYSLLDKKVYLLGTNGAAKMTGIKNGLGEILRKENPRLISLFRTNHALQNACLYATKKTMSIEVSIIFLFKKR